MHGLRLGGGFRRLTRCVALGVVGAVAFAAPVAAATTPDGVTDPGTAETSKPPVDESTTSTSVSTTTTTTSPDSSSTTAPPVTDPSAVPTDDTPTAGPPELAEKGILLPDDSLAAATEELALERAKVDLITQRLAQLDAEIADHDAKLTHVRAVRDHEKAERLDRAVATYRGQSSGWQLGILVDRGLVQERAVYLVAAADAASRGTIKEMERAAKRLTAQLKDERADRVKVNDRLADAVTHMSLLLDKLAASNGTITVIDGVLTYVPTGPSPVALLADAADTELSRLLATSQTREGDTKWLTTRHALAAEIARGKGLDETTNAAAIEKAWDATPENVVHAMLFALRQVGKAYVYATAGPVTFDCSGLTKAAYAQLHLGLPHFSGAQLHLGTPVTPDVLRPGDLLTYGPDGSEHVTMYIGDGLVVEAKGRAYGVIVAPVREDPAKGFAGATRIVP